MLEKKNPSIRYTFLEQYDPCIDIENVVKKFNANPLFVKQLFEKEIEKVREGIVRGEIIIGDYLPLFIKRSVEEIVQNLPSQNIYKE